MRKEEFYAEASTLHGGDLIRLVNFPLAEIGPHPRRARNGRYIQR